LLEYQIYVIDVCFLLIRVPNLVLCDIFHLRPNIVIHLFSFWLYCFAIFSIDAPIEIDGLIINSNDWVYGDSTGVLVSKVELAIGVEPTTA
jgi:hypothetical protein